VGSIDWHKTCLQSMKTFLQEKENEAIRIMNEVYRLRQEVEYYSKQITCAEAEGKSKFDRDKYKKKKKKIIKK
jgi:hypothetical protein